MVLHARATRSTCVVCEVDSHVPPPPADPRARCAACPVLPSFLCRCASGRHWPAGGAFALYSLLCRHIGIAPHCTTPWSTRKRGQQAAAAAALHANPTRHDSGTDSAARSQSTPTQGGPPTIPVKLAAAAEDDANVAGGRSGGGERPLPWWRRFSADGEPLRRAIRRSVPLQVCKLGP